jgi:transcriptional regulator with XRE-family HTH domain
MPITVLAMKLRDLLPAHGIPTIAEFRRRAGLSKQHAWNLWHGEANIGLRMARRLEERLGIPYTVFLELERERQPAARPPGRPRTRSSPAQPSKGCPSIPPEEALDA